jgi:hypothetical protein
MVVVHTNYQSFKNLKTAYGAKFSCIFAITATVFTACGMVEGLPLAVIHEDPAGKPEDFDTDFNGATEVSKIVV